MRKLTVFVSSPGDTRRERDAVGAVLEEINATVEADVVLVAWRWETHCANRMGRSAQRNIDEQLPRYDIYVGVMSGRFGSSTGSGEVVYGSGTEKEFRDALELSKQEDGPWVAFFFNDAAPGPKTRADIEQQTKVVDFREELQADVGGLLYTYQGVDESQDGFARVLERALRRIVKRLVSPADSALPAARVADFPTLYRKWLLRACRDADLGGLQIKEGLTARLSQVYVPLSTSAPREPMASDLEEGEPGNARRLATREDARQQSLILDLLARESLYVSGGPGTGKSTFCRWLGFVIAGGEVPVPPVPAPEKFRETLPEELASRLPLVVRLREFWNYVFRLRKQEGGRDLPLDDLKQALREWLENRRLEKEIQGMDWPTLAAHLEAGSALLIFDGVDEVPPSRGDEFNPCFLRDMIIDGLARAATAWGQAGNRLLVTSRPYGLAAEDVSRLGVRHVQIADLPDELQKLLVLRWFTHLEDGDHEAGERIARGLYSAIAGREEIAQMTANPMLLTAVCVLYGAENKRLPQDKFELYERLVGNILHNRYGRQSDKIYAAHNSLRAVAFGMHTGRGLDDPDDLRRAPQQRISYDHVDVLLRLSAEIQESSNVVAQRREELLSHSGLLRASGEKSAEFAHLSFQEFLAAEELKYRHDLDDWRKLAGAFDLRADEPRWRNTLSFVFGALLAHNRPADQAKWLLERLIERCEKGPPEETAGLSVVAAECIDILRGKPGGLPDMLKQTFVNVCLNAIEQEVRPIEDRFALGMSLGRLGDPRVAPDLRMHDASDAYVLIPAGTYLLGDDKRPWQLEKPFLLSKYPVTNSQYALFMAKDEKCGLGGYDNPDYWPEEGWLWREENGVTEPFLWRYSKWKNPSQPVVGVSFWEAEAFCNWAGGRLPATNEWEAAARGPLGSYYPWGEQDVWEAGICNSWESGLRVTSPVGMFPRSASKDFGLQDTAGNVWEWCIDAAVARFRALRGGSWCSLRVSRRAAYRNAIPPVDRSHDVGFRVGAAVQPGRDKRKTPDSTCE